MQDYWQEFQDILHWDVHILNIGAFDSLVLLAQT